jgi:hypothetical protein
VENVMADSCALDTAAMPCEAEHERAILRVSHYRTYHTGNVAGRGKANEPNMAGNDAQNAASAILDRLGVEVSDDEWEAVCAALDAGMTGQDSIRRALKHVD